MSLLERVEAAKRGIAAPVPGAPVPGSPIPDAPAATTPEIGSPPAPAPASRQQPVLSPRMSARELSFRDIRNRVGEAVADALSSRIDLSNPSGVRESLAREIDEFIGDFIFENDLSLTRDERRRLVEGVIDEVAGFGPIEPLLADSTITEVMVNGPDRVYIERAGRIEKVPVTFRDDEHVLNVIDRIITPLGRHIDETSPRVDARLPDGSRVNAIIKPLSLIGPVITVRKFATRFAVDDLVRFGTASPEMFDFLKACVEAQLNIFLSGGTGSGKTTTLNVISSFIPDTERIVTIEDAAELQLSQRHVITLEARPPNLEGSGEITIRDLLRNAMHMRPDRIIVGECRAGEALDMVQAMTTGHDGSLSTGHANTPRDMLRRLETMILMTGYDLPLRAIREQIASAVDVLVHTARLRDGSRKITSITEVFGVEDDEILTQEIFRYQQTGVIDGKIQGDLKPTGIRPTFMPTFESRGVTLPPGQYGIPPQDPAQPARPGKSRWGFGGVAPAVAVVPAGLGRGRVTVAGGMAYVSAIGPVDPETGQVSNPDIKLQTRQCLANLKARLESVDSSLDAVVWANWSLREASEFDTFYEEWQRWFSGESPVGQGTLLPLSHRRAGFRVSVGVIASVPADLAAAPADSADPAAEDAAAKPPAVISVERPVGAGSTVAIRVDADRRS